MSMADVSKVIINGSTVFDLTGVTVTPDKLAKGVIAHDKSGKKSLELLRRQAQSQQKHTKLRSAAQKDTTAESGRITQMHLCMHQQMSTADISKILKKV